MNSSAALSTWWSLSWSESRRGNGESVTLSCLTMGLRPNPGSAGDDVVSTLTSLFSISNTVLTAFMVTESSSWVGGAWTHAKKWRWRFPIAGKEKALGVLLQLNSYSLGAENWRWESWEAAAWWWWWWWWDIRFAMAFPASLLRRFSMTLRSIMSLPLDIPFLIMKNMTRTMSHTFLATIGALLSISIGFICMWKVEIWFCCLK